LTRARIAAALRRAGRQRNIDQRAGQILDALRTDQLGLSDALTGAYAASVRALLAVITTMAAQIDVLEAEVNRCFGQHPERAPTTTSSAAAAPPTTKPYAPCPTALSASSTAAYATEPLQRNDRLGTPHHRCSLTT
jgi:hypothetical protein